MLCLDIRGDGAFRRSPIASSFRSLRRNATAEAFDPSSSLGAIYDRSDPLEYATGISLTVSLSGDTDALRSPVSLF